jgi:hypothetical protein
MPEAYRLRTVHIAAGAGATAFQLTALMRVVLDSNVNVSALLSGQGNPARVLNV